MGYRGIFAFDIDGTLTHRSDWVDPAVVELLEKLHAQGWAVALVTGRMFAYAKKKILDFFPFPYVLAVQNGADLLEMPSGKLLKKNYLRSDILPLLEKAHKGISEDLLLYTGVDRGDFCYYRKERFSKKMLPYLEKLQHLGGSPWKEREFAFTKGEEFSLVKCFGVYPEMKAYYDKLSPLREDKKIEVSMIKDPIDPTFFLNMITHPEANKGGVVHFLREHFQAQVVIAAGNDLNDLKMLQEADIGIAVGEVPEELKKAADILATSPESLGIIAAIEEALFRASS